MIYTFISCAHVFKNKSLFTKLKTKLKHKTKNWKLHNDFLKPTGSV